MKTTGFKISVCALAVFSLVACKKENELAFSTNPTSESIYIGEEKKVTVESFGVKSPQGYPVSDVTWSVSDQYILSVNADGVVKGLKVGIANVIGTMKDGKTVFADFSVLGHSYLYVEPTVNAVAADIKTYEELLGNVLARGSEAEGCLVYQDTTSVGKQSEFNVYILNKGAITNLLSNEAFDEAINTFLPERYVLNEEGYYNNPYNVRVYPSKSPLDNAIYYTSDKDGSNVTELSNEYKKGAKAYEDKLAAASSYSKETLDLTNDIKYDAIDKTALQNNVDETNALINSSNSISDIESKLVEQQKVMMDLYVAAGKVSAIEICRSNLKEGYDESKYYPAVWDSIQIVDANAVAVLDTAKSIKNLDQITSSVSKGYLDFLPKSAIDDYYKDQTKKEYESYAVDKKDQYDEEGLAKLEQIYKDADAALEVAYGLKDANAALKAQKDADKEVPTKKDE